LANLGLNQSQLGSDSVEVVLGRVNLLLETDRGKVKAVELGIGGTVTGQVGGEPPIIEATSSGEDLRPEIRLRVTDLGEPDGEWLGSVVSNVQRTCSTGNNPTTVPRVWCEFRGGEKHRAQLRTSPRNLLLREGARRDWGRVGFASLRARVCAAMSGAVGLIWGDWSAGGRARRCTPRNLVCMAAWARDTSG
jgi:hypothetical protein